MATVTMKGNEVHTNGDLPAIGSKAPDFTLVDGGLKSRSLSDYAGKKKVLNIAPSLDTPVCAKTAREFENKVKNRDDVAVLTITADLPFAQSRFCKAEGIENVQTLSMMRSKDFASDYGVLLQDGPLEGLSARAVVVLDENDQVIHTELVPEITEEPDYDKALAAL